MKTDPWISALAGVFGLLAVTFLVLVCLFIFNARESRRLQPQVANANMARNIAGMLANEVVEYGKQHPDILEYTGLKAMMAAQGNAAAPTTSKPQGK